MVSSLVDYVSSQRGETSQKTSHLFAGKCNCKPVAAAQVGGGEGKVSAIELPAAAVAVADGFQELEWLLLAGAPPLMQSKCPQESAAERGSSLFLH